MPHKFRRRGKWTGQWHGQVKFKGKKYRKLFPTKTAALDWEALVRAEMEGRSSPILKEKTATACLLEWAEKYLNHSLMRHKPKVYNEKRCVFKRLCKHFDPDMPAADITPGLALGYLQGQYSERSGYAANKERKNLGAAWAWGSKYLDLPAKNPFLEVEKFPELRQERYVPSVQDFWKVAAVAEGQDRVLLLMFLFTAARRGELFRLKWSDIDFIRSKVRLVTYKTRGGSPKEDWLPMVAELAEMLGQHQKAAVNEWVFVQTGPRGNGRPLTDYRGFPQDLCRKAGVRPFGCHGIRHLTASILATEGTPAVSIKAILRHGQLRTTERYVHAQAAIEPFLEAIGRGNEQRPNKRPKPQKKSRALAATRTRQ